MNQVPDENARSSPLVRSIRTMREALSKATVSELTAETATISCNQSICSSQEEFMLSCDGSFPSERLFRHSSTGPSAWTEPPPRLTRELSSDSTGSFACKRSIEGSPRAPFAGAKTDSKDCNYFIDDEIIRQQIEIMQQIQREQKALEETKKECSDRAKLSAKEDASQKPISRSETRSMSPVRLMSSAPEDNYLDHYLDDPVMIREQQRIMDEIVRQQKLPSSMQLDDEITTKDDCVKEHKSLASSNAMSSSTSSRPCSLHLEKESFLLNDSQRRPDVNKAAFCAQPLEGPSSKDRTVLRAYGSQSLRIKGTDHTWKEIDQGKATIVTCPWCCTVLQVSRKAKLLYCTHCQEVSPMAIADSMLSTTNDVRIARVLQQQERHVASVRKLAKEEGRWR